MAYLNGKEIMGVSQLTLLDGAGDQTHNKEEQEKTVTITENGTTEILPDTDKALSKVTVNVDVEQGVFPSGEIAITENGVYDVTNYESANVEIQGGSGSSDLFPYVRYVDFTSDLQEVTEDITLHLERAPGLSQMFTQSHTINASKITVYISDKCVDMNAFLRGNGKQEALKTVKIIGDTKQIKNFNSAFYWRIALETIECEFDFSSATTVGSMLSYCYALKEVRFKPNTLSLTMNIANSPDLSDKSIQSIIDGLADLTGGTAQTLTFHTDVKAKLTEQQISSITDKNWTLA